MANTSGLSSGRRRDRLIVNGELAEEQSATLRPGAKRKRNDTEQVRNNVGHPVVPTTPLGQGRLHDGGLCDIKVKLRSFELEQERVLSGLVTVPEGSGVYQDNGVYRANMVYQVNGVYQDQGETYCNVVAIGK